MDAHDRHCMVTRGKDPLIMFGSSESVKDVVESGQKVLKTCQGKALTTRCPV